MSEPKSRFCNSILRALPLDVIDRLELTALPLPTRKELQSVGKEIDHIVFLESGVASMTMAHEDGSQVEVGAFGFESAIGVSALLGPRKSLVNIFMQVGGHGFVTSRRKAREEFQRAGEFHALALRFVQAQLDQAAVSSACNLRHQLNQRLARWLLLCADRTQEDVFDLSQEFLSIMLGTRRTTVTLAIKGLVSSGIIEHSRRKIKILDREMLESRACECYQLLRARLENSDHPAKEKTFDRQNSNKPL